MATAPLTKPQRLLLCPVPNREGLSARNFFFQPSGPVLCIVHSTVTHARRRNGVNSQGSPGEDYFLVCHLQGTGNADQALFQKAAFLLLSILAFGCWLLGKAKELHQHSLCQHVSLQGLSCRVCGIPVHTRVSTCWQLGENGEEGEGRLSRADSGNAHSQARPRASVLTHRVQS